MSTLKPYKRTCRQLIDGTYSNSGNWLYLLHKDFVTEPQHYLRSFYILQKDFVHLLEYVEPCDQNLPTLSFRIHELLTRTCIEIEANFTAILTENIYTKAGNLNMKDYELVNQTHFLSSYSVSLPVWKGISGVRTPFAPWASGTSLGWYQAYNKSKHNRHQHFDKATFENLVDAIGALVVLLSAQFNKEDYSLNDRGLSIGYGYDNGDGMESAVGGYFRVRFPSNLPLDQRYDFDWQTLKDDPHPIDRLSYDQLK